MDTEVHRYKSQIGDRTYTIVGNKNAQHMKAVTELVNEQIEQIKEKSDHIDNEQAAVLVAVNAVSKQVDMQKRIQEIEKSINDLQQSTIRFNKEGEDLS